MVHSEDSQAIVMYITSNSCIDEDEAMMDINIKRA